MSRPRAALLLLAFGVALCHAQTTPAAPDLSHYSQSITVPFSDPVDFKHLKTLRVRASINGGPAVNFVVDTGSVGIIVTADDVPNFDPKGTPGEITYTSSGVHLEGVWTKAVVTYPDARGGKASALVPVLAVMRETCTGSGVNAARCQPTDHPHTHMMGIGFGRAKDTGGPDHNPFLNLREMQAGTMRRGYTISRQGFTLGLTPEVAAPGYTWQKLASAPVNDASHAAQPDLHDWETAPGTFRIQNAQAAPGTILMDTGLPNMMLATAEATPGTTLRAGTPVTIELLGGKLSYTITAGDDKNPQQPSKITFIRPSHGVFVNTGLMAFAGFDYLYDSDEGWLALRPVAP